MVDIVVPVSVRDLTVEDLPACAWSGTATHLAAVARELARARRGEVDYLAVCLRRLRPRAGCVGRWGPGRFGDTVRDGVHADAQDAAIASRVQAKAHLGHRVPSRSPAQCSQRHRVGHRVGHRREARASPKASQRAGTGVRRASQASQSGGRAGAAGQLVGLESPPRRNERTIV